MKTQTNKMMKLLLGAFAAIVLTTACQKNSNNSPAPVAPPLYPNGCVNAAYCPPGVGSGQLLYNGQTQGNSYVMAQFQVNGNTDGNGAGTVSGVVQFSNWVCANGGNLAGQYQLTGQGSLTGGQFNGYATLSGAQQVYLQIDPGSRTMQGSGLFSITIPNCMQIDGSPTRFDVNF